MEALRIFRYGLKPRQREKHENIIRSKIMLSVDFQLQAESLIVNPMRPYVTIPHQVPPRFLGPIARQKLNGSPI